MRHQLRTLFTASALVFALAFGMAACSTLPRVVGAETAQTIELRALQGAKAALKVWSLAQKAALVYGRLPNCDPEIPDFKVCKEPKVWAKMKDVGDEYSAKILAARPLVEAGTDDVAFLVGVTALVNEGVIEINEARGVSAQ